MTAVRVAEQVVVMHEEINICADCSWLFQNSSYLHEMFLGLS